MARYWGGDQREWLSMPVYEKEDLCTGASAGQSTSRSYARVAVAPSLPATAAGVEMAWKLLGIDWVLASRAL